MTPEAVAWAIGLGLPCLAVAVLFLANWCHALNSKISENAKSIADMRAHTAENYVRGPEVTRVEDAVKALTVKVDTLLASVHQLLGRQGT
jgi:hypothetical protein